MEKMFEEKQIELLKKSKKDYIRCVVTADYYGKIFMLILRYILIPLYVYAAATMIFNITFDKDIAAVLDKSVIIFTIFEIILFIIILCFSFLAMFKNPPEDEKEKECMKKIFKEHGINIDFY